LRIKVENSTISTETILYGLQNIDQLNISLTEFEPNLSFLNNRSPNTSNNNLVSILPAFINQKEEEFKDVINDNTLNSNSNYEFNLSETHLQKNIL
jgi:hypothetical protein